MVGKGSFGKGARRQAAARMLRGSTAEMRVPLPWIELTVSSQPGQGTRILASLPKAATPAPAPLAETV